MFGVTHLNIAETSLFQKNHQIALQQIIGYSVEYILEQTKRGQHTQITGCHHHCLIYSQGETSLHGFNNISQLSIITLSAANLVNVKMIWPPGCVQTLLYG